MEVAKARAREKAAGEDLAKLARHHRDCEMAGEAMVQAAQRLLEGTPSRIGELNLRADLARAVQHWERHQWPDLEPRVNAEEPTTTINLLEPAELRAIDLTAELASLLFVICGPDAPADLDELVHHLHVIQRYIGSQAAARAYPGKFRPLGQTLRTS